MVRVSSDRGHRQQYLSADTPHRRDTTEVPGKLAERLVHIAN